MARGRHSRHEPVAASRLSGDGRRMSDYLNNLVARQLGLTEVVRPRLIGRFEPPFDARAPGPWGPAAAERAPEPEPRESTFGVEWRAEERGGAERETVPSEEPARVTS